MNQDKNIAAASEVRTRSILGTIIFVLITFGNFTASLCCIVVTLAVLLAKNGLLLFISESNILSGFLGVGARAAGFLGLFFFVGGIFAVRCMFKSVTQTTYHTMGVIIVLNSVMDLAVYGFHLTPVIHAIINVTIAVSLFLGLKSKRLTFLRPISIKVEASTLPIANSHNQAMSPTVVVANMSNMQTTAMVPPHTYQMAPTMVPTMMTAPPTLPPSYAPHQYPHPHGHSQHY